MSCEDTPKSAYPTCRKSGAAPTPHLLLWSENVGEWYRRQRAQGVRPEINMPTPVAALATRGQSREPWFKRVQAAIGRLVDLDPQTRCESGMHGGKHRLITFANLQDCLEQADEVVACAWTNVPGGDYSHGTTTAALVFRKGTYVVCLTTTADSGEIYRLDRRCRSVTKAQETFKRWTRKGKLFFCVCCRTVYFHPHPLTQDSLCPTCRSSKGSIK